MSKHSFVRFLKGWRNHGPVLKWLSAHTKPFLPQLMLLLVIGVVESLLMVGMTVVGKQIIDHSTLGDSLTGKFILYVAVMLFSLLASAGNIILSALINERFSFGIRLKIYRAIMFSDWKHITRYHSGDIATRLTSDIDIVATGIAEIIPSIFSLGFSFVAAFITLLYFDPNIALFALFLGPVTAVIGILSGRMIKPLQIKMQESESAYKSFIQESISNLLVFKAFDLQDKACDSLSALREERLGWVLKRQKVSALTGILLTGSYQFGYITAFAYSSLRLSAGLITYGTMTVFLTLVSQIQAPIVGLSRLVPRIVSIFASAGRLIEIESIAPEDMSTAELSDPPPGLRVTDVSFAYDGGKESVLEHASVLIEPGTFVAVMGSSGIGKTTLIRLIMSYLKPDAGSLELFNRNGQRAPVTAGVRKYISYVPQGNTMLSGTIAGNLLQGNFSVTEDEIWEILRVVAVDEFVRELPDGLYTQIGERGVGLSEGQAQRLAIARALAKKAPFLILDEATSALDGQTEMEILRHLRQSQGHITCLLITHRPSVLEFCDGCVRIHNKGLIYEDLASKASSTPVVDLLSTSD